MVGYLLGTMSMHLHRLAHFKFVPVKLGAIGVGLVLLLAGRKLFWLFVAAIGFIAAFHFSSQLLRPEDHTIVLVLSLVAGLAGALLAIFVQKVAIGCAGAVAGALYSKMLLDMNGVTDTTVTLVAVVVGAIVGALLMLFVFKWALILFSSVAGAQLITHAFALAPQMSAALFTVLLLVGLVVQARQGRPATD